MNRPALAAVRARAQAGAWPAVHEYLALLEESGADQAEARGLTLRYAAALGSITTGPLAEARLMTSLRSFALPPE